MGLFSQLMRLPTGCVTTLQTGDVFFADVGCEHVAHPVGEARILVVERAGSV
jgi:hypothetical protein